MAVQRTPKPAKIDNITNINPVFCFMFNSMAIPVSNLGIAFRVGSNNMTSTVSDDRLIMDVETQRLGSLHIFVLCLCAIGFGFDLAELGLGNILSAIFTAAPYNANAAQLSWLLAAPYIGGIIGAPLYGWLADRWGRRSTLSLMLVTLGIFSALASQSERLETLTLYRALCGLTLGAFPPIVIAYMTDLLPAKIRGRAIMITCGAAILSVPLSIFFMRWLTPLKPFGLDAWRCGFILYGMGSLLTGIAMLWAPESVRWLIKMGKADEAHAAVRRLGRGVWPPVRQGSVEPETLRHNPGIVGEGRLTFLQIGAFVVFSFIGAWATVSFPLLSGAILVQKGVQLPDALLYVGIAALGPFLGMFVSAFVIDRMGRRPALWASGAIMTGMSAVFVMGDTPWLFIASGLIFQIANSIFVPTTSMYLAEVFSTGMRGRATSGLWAVNRFGSVVAPFLMLPLLQTNGAFPLFLITASALLLCMVLLAVMPRGRAGQAVD